MPSFARKTTHGRRNSPGASMQSKLQSLLEVTLSTLAGFLLALLLQVFLTWVYDMPMSLWVNFKWTLWFTLLSLTRSYLFRRFFNWFHSRNT
jgi:hypothetical protein